MIVLCLIIASVAFSKEIAPPWTEKTAWIEGEELRVTGLASHAKSREQGRQEAYENGIREIDNFFQSIGGEIPPILTQMIYEEPEADGSFTIYRLLKVKINSTKSNHFYNRYTSLIGKTGSSLGSLKIMTVPTGAEIYLERIWAPSRSSFASLMLLATKSSTLI